MNAFVNMDQGRSPSDDSHSVVIVVMQIVVVVP